MTKFFQIWIQRKKWDKIVILPSLWSLLATIEKMTECSVRIFRRRYLEKYCMDWKNSFGFGFSVKNQSRQDSFTIFLVQIKQISKFNIKMSDQLTLPENIALPLVTVENIARSRDLYWPIRALDIYLRSDKCNYVLSVR